MRFIWASLRLIVLCAATTAALGQAAGVLRGVVTAEGAPVASAPVQAVNHDSGVPYRTLSNATGEYSLRDLPAGTYDVSVVMPGFQYVRFLQPGVLVGGGEDRRTDIPLQIGNLGTIGDDPFTYLAEIRDEAKDLTGPAPRTADGHPDLSGVWNGNDDLYPENPALLPWAGEILAKRIASDFQGLPRGLCLPAGVLPVGPFFRKFVQTPNLLVVLNEDEVVGFRQIFLDGRAHPPDLAPTWQGHSIGHWEGDTFVVDVTGFNDKSVMQIFPHTEQLHVTERYRRRDLGHMDVQVIAEDPGTLAKPWTLNMVWDLAPEQEMQEYVCTESVLNMHLEWREAAGY